MPVSLSGHDQAGNRSLRQAGRRGDGGEAFRAAKARALHQHLLGHADAAGEVLGGGAEFSMACHARVVGKGVMVGQPEVNLGIIPGAGGTQRLPRIIGIEKAAELMRTARPISSDQAQELGLISEQVDDDLVGRAIDLAKGLADGSVQAPAMPTGPPEDVPASLPDVDIKHRSKAVDAILVKAILEGAKLGLREGVALESRCFGEVCGTKDMRIGVDNFLTNGPRAKAEFVHG